MSRNHVSARNQCVAVLTLSFAAVNGHAIAAEVTIWNEVVGTGSLTVTTDDFGSFGTGLGWPDLFDMGPLSEPPGEHPFTFATNLFVFVDPSEIGQGTHRGVLSTHPLLLGMFPDGNLHGDVTSPNVLLDTQTAASAFTLQGNSVNLHWTLTQKVSPLPDGPQGGPSAILEQTYTFTNHGDGAMEFIVVKHLDPDLPDDGGTFPLFHTVGVDYSELGREQVYARKLGSSVAAIVLRTREDMTLDPRTVDTVYYVGRQNMPSPPGNSDYPGGACPSHDYGTDLQIWDSYGVPNCWKNFVPGVGYDVPGSSPLSVNGDSFIGLQVEVALPPGDTYEITFATVYGNAFHGSFPKIVHEQGLPGQTRPFSAYVDPRTDVSFPPLPAGPVGLTEAFIRFNRDVMSCDLSPIGPDDFVLTETGDLNPPTVVSAEYVDLPDRSYVRVTWDRPITLQEWTTLRADVCSLWGIEIQSQGDMGPGINEPDRIDLTFLPADVDQNGINAPFDILVIRQYLNDINLPEMGTLEDFVDIDRNSVITPFDLLRVRQLLNGIPPATRPWAGESLNHPRP